jgi:hypothetical protein
MSQARIRDAQKGEGKAGTIFWLAALLLFLFALAHVGPVYWADYTMTDNVTEIAHLQRGLNPDDKIMAMLLKAAEDHDLASYLDRTSFQVTTRDASRRIVYAYDRTVTVLPGWQKTFHFAHDIDEPSGF